MVGASVHLFAYILDFPRPERMPFLTRIDLLSRLTCDVNTVRPRSTGIDSLSLFWGGGGLLEMDFGEILIFGVFCFVFFFFREKLAKGDLSETDFKK